MIFESVPVLPPLNITLPLWVIPLPVRVDLIRETVMIHDDSYKMFPLKVGLSIQFITLAWSQTSPDLRTYRSITTFGITDIVADIQL